MYTKIQQHKNLGSTRESTARDLKLSWATVDRYWMMTEDEYNSQRTQQFSSGLDIHRDVIVSWLTQNDEMSAAQVKDWIHEHYNEIFKERTVRNYVKQIREEYNIVKKFKTRDYGVIPQLPPGQQLQADFGFYNAVREDKRRIRLYFVIFILAHSRYKYIVWQTKHFTSQDFVSALGSCFHEFGGIPMELVIDQDRLMIVNENYGDIIYTHEFEQFKNTHKFSVWLCRKGDPESKGMIESGVKFVKYNFAQNRIFTDLSNWSKDCTDWLIRTGNGKEHSETKKIPAEEFVKEKDYLKPVNSFTSPNTCSAMTLTPVLKSNVIRYKSSRYSVPLGTFKISPKVFVLADSGVLEIYNMENKLIASHQIAIIPGELVVNNNHARDNSVKIQNMMAETLHALGGTEKAQQFLEKIQKKRKRYIRDQLQLILSVAGNYETEIVHQAMLACVECDSDSATDFKDFANHLFRQITLEEIQPMTPATPVVGSAIVSLNFMKVSQHASSVYNKIIQGGE